MLQNMFLSRNPELPQIRPPFEKVWSLVNMIAWMKRHMSSATHSVMVILMDGITVKKKSYPYLLFWNPLQATYKKNTAQYLIMRCCYFSKRVRTWICFSLPSFFSSCFRLFPSVCRSHMKIIFHTWQLTHNMGLFALNSAPQAVHSMCKMSLCGIKHYPTLWIELNLLCIYATIYFLNKFKHV